MNPDENHLEFSPQEPEILKPERKPYKKATLLIILLIFVVILILLGYYLFFSAQNKNTQKKFVINQPTPTITATQNSAQNPNEVDKITPIATIWEKGTKIFTNHKIDIAFRYPSLMIEAINPNNTTSVTFSTPPLTEIARSHTDYNDESNNTAEIFFNTNENQNNLSIADFIRLNYNSAGVDGHTPAYKSYEDNLTPVDIKNIQSFLYEGSGGGEVYKKIYFIPYKNKIYNFTLVGGLGVGDGYSKDAEVLLNKMLNSIEFK